MYIIKERLKDGRVVILCSTEWETDAIKRLLVFKNAGRDVWCVKE